MDFPMGVVTPNPIGGQGSWQVSGSGLSYPSSGFQGEEEDLSHWSSAPDPEEHPLYELYREKDRPNPAGRCGKLPPIDPGIPPAPMPHPEAHGAGPLGGGRPLGATEKGFNPGVAADPLYTYAQVPDVYMPHAKHPKTGKAFPDNQYLGNDIIGDCVTAMWGHYTNYVDWLNGGTGFLCDAQDALDMYEWCAGWDGIARSPSDAGTYMAQANTYMARFGLQNRRINGVGYIPVRAEWAYKQVIFGFLAQTFGVLLPLSAEQQFVSKQPWTVVKNSPIVSGHAIVGIGYDAKYVYCYTWGHIVQVTFDWLNTYVDESYVVANDAQIGAPGWEKATIPIMNRQWQYYIGYTDEVFNEEPITTHVNYTDPGGSGSGAGQGGGR